MSFRLADFMGRYRAAIVALLTISALEFLFAEEPFSPWYAVVLLTVLFYFVGAMAWSGALYLAQRMLGLKDDIVDNISGDERAMFAVFLCFSCWTYYQNHQENQRFEALARCVREEEWRMSGYETVTDPVEWCDAARQSADDEPDWSSTWY